MSIYTSQKERELFFESVGVSSTPFLAQKVREHFLRFFHILFCNPVPSRGRCTVLSRTGVFVNALSRLSFRIFLCLSLRHLYSITFFHCCQQVFQTFFKNFSYATRYLYSSSYPNTRSIPAFPTPDRAFINILTHCLYIK